MKIIDIQLGEITIPLVTPFKTSLRTVTTVNDIIVKIITDTGNVGFGEAPPTAVITGDTKGSIVCAIRDFITPNILGMEIENLEGIMTTLHACLVGNTSAKAAVDMAIYDLYGQLYDAPLYQLLGGYRKEITTDLTISVNPIDEMVEDSLKAVVAGYDTLKIKVGKEGLRDIERIQAIRNAVGKEVELRVDANQGWSAKESVRIITKMEDLGLNIELVEQPVVAWDVDGLKYVTDRVYTPILADECVFSADDAIRIIQLKAADLINIKLMKTGGIYNALKICAVAEIYDVKCMVGCMLESKLAASAAANLAAAKKIITKIDLDGPGLCKNDPYIGGPVYEQNRIVMSENAGMGFVEIDNSFYKKYE